VKPSFLVSENAIVVVLPYVIESLNQDKSNKKENTNLLVGKEKIIYDLIAAHPNIKRADIQNYIKLEKSQTIELINKLRDSGSIIKVGNGPSTGYKILS
jgi:hypothetical protein